MINLSKDIYIAHYPVKLVAKNIIKDNVFGFG